MAVTETLYITNTTDKLWNTSGQFTATVRDSLDRNGIDTSTQGISWDGTNTVWVGSAGDKLYLDSGKFAGTLKTSVLITTIDTFPRGCGSDGTNTPWQGATADKNYLQSGQFSTTLKTSRSATADARGDCDAIDGPHTTWSYDTTNNNWYMYESGQFSSTIRDSQNFNSIDTGIRGSTWDGTNSPWCGVEADKNYLASGLITSTIKTSLAAGENSPTGCTHDDFDARMGTAAEDNPYELETPGELVLTGNTPDMVLDHRYEVTGTDANLTLTGNTPDFGISYTFEVTGTDANLALTGNTPDWSEGIIYTLESGDIGVLTFTGNTADALVPLGYEVETATELTLTGNTPDLGISYAFEVTGTDAVLSLTGNVPDWALGFQYSLDDLSELTLTGNTPEFGINLVFEATQSTLTLTGNTPDFSIGTLYDLQTPSELVLTGNTPDFSLNFFFEATSGALILTGHVAHLFIPDVVAPAPGVGRARQTHATAFRPIKQRGYPRRIKIGDRWFTVNSWDEEVEAIQRYLDYQFKQREAAQAGPERAKAQRAYKYTARRLTTLKEAREKARRAQIKASNAQLLQLMDAMPWL